MAFPLRSLAALRCGVPASYFFPVTAVVAAVWLAAPAAFAAAPGNDNFANADAITGRSFEVIASNTDATFEAGEPNHTNSSPIASVWWSWTAPFASPVVVETRGSNFDTRLAIYTGSAVNALASVTFNDDVDSSIGRLDSALMFVATAGTTYRIAVDGYQGATGSIVLRLNATVLEVSTVAGAAGASGTADGTGGAARFNFPRGVAREPISGDYFISDTGDHRIRRMTPAGVVTTVTGSAGSGWEDGPVATAKFLSPVALAFDPSGNLYVGDSDNHRIRKITPAGIVSTFAGSGVEGSSDAPVATDATFRFPQGIAVDSAFNIYVADTDNHRIRKITPAGAVVHLAGQNGVPGSADGTSTVARFNLPQYLAVDSAGNVYVTDTGNHTIRKITPGGTVTTVAGTANQQGTSDGLGAVARFRYPQGIAVDDFGVLYVADQVNQTIRRISPSGVVTTIAGNIGVSGTADGIGPAAGFVYPFGVVLDAAGNVIIADAGNSTIRRGVPVTELPTIATHPRDIEVVTGGTATFDVVAAAPSYQWYRRLPDGSSVPLSDDFTFSGTATPRLTITGVTADLHGADFQAHVFRGDAIQQSNVARLTIAPDYMVSTLAGAAGQVGSTDGTGSAARFQFLKGTAVDATGAVYVADYNNRAVRKITPSGIVTTLAGSPGQFGNVDGIGAEARFAGVRGLALDAAGNLYVSDETNHNIRKITPSGQVTTLAGPTGVSGQFGNVDATGTDALFNTPAGLTVDPSNGDLYIADIQNHSIRKLTPAGVVTTYAGSTAGAFGYRDGSRADARFDFPHDVKFDASGNLFIVDSSNFAIRRISPAGVVSTWNGPITLNVVTNLAIDTTGNLYVGEPNNRRILKITPDRIVTTIAGTGANGSADGPGNTATFGRMDGISADMAGNIYVADSSNFTVRKLTPLITPLTITTQPADTTVTAGYNSTFTVVAPGTTFQWSRSTDLGVTWQPISNGVGESGTTTPQLTITGVTTSMNGNLYRVTVANGGVATLVDSASARLTVEPRYQVSTFAGEIGVQGTNDGTGTAAHFKSATEIAVDAAGNLYVSDLSNRIRKITPGGVVTTLAGMVSALGGSSDGIGEFASFKGPAGLAVDRAGTVFVADSANHTIRKITSAGVVTTFVGTASAIGGSTDATGPAASFNSPWGVALDAVGNLYVADSNNHTIRKITPEGVVTTFAGTALDAGHVDAAGTAARFNTPTGITIDGAGNLYVSEYSGHTIRKITPAGEVTTIAGAAGTPGSADGVGTAARFNQPYNLKTDAAGNLFVADQGNHTIRKISPAGVVTTVIGAAGSSGSTNGLGATARLYSPEDIAVDAAGNLYIADVENRVVRRAVPISNPVAIGTQPSSTGVVAGGNATFTIAAAATTFTWQRSTDGGTSWSNLSNDSTFSGVSTAQLTITGATTAMDDHRFRAVVANGNGSTVPSNPVTLHVSPVYQVSTLAGTAGQDGSTDATGAAARFDSPWAAAVDAQGNVFVADRSNSTIRKISPAGVVTTFAGTAGITGSEDDTGAHARFDNPESVAIDVFGNVYVADTFNHTIRKITPAGVVSTVAGLAGAEGSTNGTGTGARFNIPRGIAVDLAGNLYVADWGASIIRKITPAGVVTTLAGSPGNDGSADGNGAAARFNGPYDLTVDAAGMLFVADGLDHTIRQITPTGDVTTLAGSAGVRGHADGAGTTARFSNPYDVAVDAAGRLFVPDWETGTIRQITPDGVVTTIAGLAGTYGSTNGPGATARFLGPQGAAIDAAGNVYVTESENNTLRKLTPLLSTLTIATQPVDTAVSAGYAATFTVVAPGTTFQWQRSINGGTTWTDVTELGTYSGATTPQLTITSPTTTMSGEQFRVVIGNGGVATAVTSTARTLTVGPAYVVSTIAGTGSTGFVNGTGTAASFSFPYDVVVEPAGDVLVADFGNKAIRRITPTRVVTTFVDSTVTPIDPYDLALDGFNNLFVAEFGLGRIRKVTPAGVATIVPSAVTLTSPAGVDIDAAGTLFVTDYGAKTVNRISTTGVVTTFTGFNGPVGIAVDANGTLFVADDADKVIRQISPAGAITTLAGMFGIAGGNDGAGTAARFTMPEGMAIDAAGNLYVADVLDATIRQITPAGIVTTLVGLPGARGNLDGTGVVARINSPSGVGVDSAGNLYIADTDNHSIRKATPVYDLPAIRGNLTAAANGATNFSYTITANSAPFTYNALGLPAGLTINRDTGVISGAPTVVGSFNVTISASNLTGSAEAVLNIIIVAPAAPVLNPAPAAASAAAGATAQFTATATGATTLTYQWQMQPAGGGAWTNLANNATYSGVTTATLQVRAAAALHGQLYRLIVTDTFGTATTSTGVVLTVTPGSRLLNLSTRGLAGAGANQLFPGFVVSGSGTKKLLIRAIGPSLGDLAPSLTVLPDPRMELKRFNFTTQAYEDLQNNDNWQTNANAAEISTVGAQVFAFPFTDAADAALLVDLPAGQYAVVGGDKDGTSAIGIVELYDADTTPTATLINISNRGFCGVGDSVMIPGFVISSEGPKTLLVRVVGPTLGGFGVPGTMVDPKLELFPAGSTTPLLANDNWGENPDAATTAQTAINVSAFALAAGSTDAAMVVTLPPGGYTVVGSSAVAGGTGVVLVEVYVVE